MEQAVEGACDYSLVELMKYLQYWMFVFIFLILCMSGLYVIGVVKDIG